MCVEIANASNSKIWQSAVLFFISLFHAHTLTTTEWRKKITTHRWMSECGGKREKIPRKKWDRNKIEGWFKVFHTKYAYVAIFLVLHTHAHTGTHSPLSHKIIVIFFSFSRSSVWVWALLHIHFAATQNVAAFFPRILQSSHDTCAAF